MRLFWLWLLLSCAALAPRNVGGTWKQWRKGQRVYFYETSEEEYWTDALEDCREKDATLLVINSREENVWVWANRRTRRSYWMGFYYDHKLENRYKRQWVDGASMIYQNWRESPEPPHFRLGYLPENRGGRWETEKKHNPCNFRVSKLVGTTIMNCEFRASWIHGVNTIVFYAINIYYFHGQITFVT